VIQGDSLAELETPNYRGSKNGMVNDGDNPFNKRFASIHIHMISRKIRDNFVLP